MKLSNRRGYTLMELVIAILIVGILASFAVPQYLRTIEGGKYDDAVALVNQIGMTNRMFALDHSGVYVAGQFLGNSCGCTSTTCSNYAVPASPGPFGTPCALVCCNYLGDQDWSAKPYDFYACDPASNGGGGPCATPTNPVSGATRVTSGANGTNISPYKTWGVYMNTTGTISNVTGATNPPNPTY